MGKLFDALDINGDEDLSFNEFSLYLEGAKRTQMSEVGISNELIEEMKQQIDELFK